MRFLNFLSSFSRKFGTFASLELNIWLWILLLTDIMSHTMEVDSQDSSVAGSQTVNMEDDCTFGRQSEDSAARFNSGHRLMEPNEMGDSENQKMPEKCDINISDICMKEEKEHAISDSDSKHRLKTENEVLQSDPDAKAGFDKSVLEHRSCREPINDEHLECQEPKADEENHLTDVDGTESNLRSSESALDPTHQLATLSPVEKPVCDGSSVSRSDQSLNSGVNAGISSASSTKVISRANEGILEQKETGEKFLNDENSRVELTVEDETEPEHSYGVVSEETVIRSDTDTDVEIIDVEGAKPEIVVESGEDDDGENEELMGFHFNEDEALVDKYGQPFEFHKYQTHFKNQRRYERLGEKITEYIYNLLETRCKLERIFIPVDAKPGEDQSFIFVSKNAFETDDKLIIFIHGTGVVRAGQWARSLIINDSLRSGTQIPFIEKALECGYEVMVLNTNLNSLPGGKRIRGSEDAESHALYVWENFVEKKVKAKHIAVVAHSYGGCVTKELVTQKSDQFYTRVFAIAFTDSVHSLNIAYDPPEVIRFFREHARNWVTSSLALDEPVKGFSLQRTNDAPRFSAGHEKHEWTSWSSFTAIFKFLNETYKNLKPQNSQL